MGVDLTALPDNSFMVKLQVTEKGFVEDVEVLSKTSVEQEEAILKVSTSWLFIPCVQDGKYTRAIITFPVSK